MREIEAFSYWPDHASAIDGFGGERRSPDPRYCFHTLYNDVRSGPARYVLRVKGARASKGELSLRIHAFRPPNDAAISLVSGARLDFLGMGGSGMAADDVVIEVPFMALRGVLYAFYGYFSEYSDIQAEHVQVELIEPEEDADHDVVEATRSVLAQREVSHEVRPANALIHGEAPLLDVPVSQDCTRAQIAALLGKRRFDAAGLSPQALAELQARWRERVCLTALEAYQVEQAGLDGWVVDEMTAETRALLADSSFIMEHRRARDLEAQRPEFADFILWPHASDLGEKDEARWALVRGVLGHLKIGGMAVIGLTYRFEPDLVSSSQAALHLGLSRNEISQWALRLVGSAFSVAPLSFAEPGEIMLDAQDQTSFALIVHRL